MRDRTSTPLRLQRAQFDSDRRKRSWRTIEAGGVDPKGEILQLGRHPLSGSSQIFEFDRAGKDTREKGMQRTAVVGSIPALIAMMIKRRRINLTMDALMLMMRVQSVRHLRALGIGQRRRHHARELSNEEQADQEADKARYGPEPLH